jgi:TRAP-type C4-dicarboxylate transport system substrate-binding protein
MKIGHRSAKIFAATALLWCGFAPAPAAAEETTLIFATTNPATAHLNARVLHPWAARINEQGKGVVRIDVRDGPTLANSRNFYGRVVDDVVQITFGGPTGVAGKFPLSEVAALPFLVETSEAASVAFWRLYKSGLLDGEYNEIVPMFLVVFPPVGVHTAKPLRTLESLAGVKLVTLNKLQSQVVERLGGLPLAMPIIDIYEAVQRGTADGTTIQWTAFQPFKLAEVTTYHVDVFLGSQPSMVIMAKKKYEALPAAARKIIDDNSGESQTRVFGKFWDAVDVEARTAVKASGKHTVVDLPPELNAKWRSQVAPVTAEWAKTTPGGEKVLSTYRELLAKARSGG